MRSRDAIVETFATRWGRRALTLTLYPALFAGYVATFPFTLALCLVLDAVRGSRGTLTRTLVFFGLYLACEIAGIVAAFLLWLAYRLLPGVSHSRYLHWNFRLQCLWARALGRGGFRIFRMKVTIDEPRPLGARPLLLLVRHVSTADTILASIFVAERYGIVLRYVLKRELLWDPCLDIVGNRLVNVFVRRGGGDTEADLAAVTSLTEGLQPHEGILIYPEGTRFTAAKRRRIIEKLSQREDEVAASRARDLTHVLPPRLGGTLALLERASTWDIGICTHIGMDDATSFADFLGGALVGSEVRVRIDIHRGDTLPRDREGLTEWIYDRWREVNRFVATRGA